MKRTSKSEQFRHRDTAPDGGRAFLPDSREGRTGPATDELAETLAEEYLAAATSGEEVSEDVRDEFMTEEVGGPFVVIRLSEVPREGVAESPAGEGHAHGQGGHGAGTAKHRTSRSGRKS